MEENKPTNVVSLSDFLPKTAGAARTVEVDFKGIRFKVRHVNRTQLFNLGQSCTILSYDANTKTRVPRLDLPKLAKALANVLVVDWSGVTLRTLQGLMVLDGVDKLDAAQLDAPIPFTTENLEMLLTNANGLDEFLQDVAMDPANFRTVPPSELAKN